MREELKGKSFALKIVMFVLNVILLFALVFLMLEMNEGMYVITYITDHVQEITFVAAAIVILSILTFAYFYFECPKLLTSITKIIEAFVILDVALLISFVIGKYIDHNARPFAFFAITAATLLGRREAIFLNIIYALIMFIIDINITASQMWENCACLLITFCAGMTVIFVSQSVKTRLQGILLVLLLLIPIELIMAIMEVIFTDKPFSNIIVLAYGAFGAFASIMSYVILLPVFEVLFSELTIYRLRELTSEDAKLIKKLKKEAPGTYNHTVVVAQLVEACAMAIGEDGELARAAAFYHDMGKLKNPEMFTENQSGYNVHNELTPELSVDIIRSHTKDGAKLLRKNRIPEFFADIAIQHHGTLPIKYFYAKALKLSDGELNVANYSYGGPIPQTRIAAIVMIADASEAASRSLKERSAEKIEELVRGIIEERIDLGQFDNCDITMKEFSIISRTIASSLSGVYHSRVSYPKIKVSKSK